MVARRGVAVRPGGSPPVAAGRMSPLFTIDILSRLRWTARTVKCGPACDVPPARASGVCGQRIWVMTGKQIPHARQTLPAATPIMVYCAPLLFWRRLRQVQILCPERAWTDVVVQVGQPPRSTSRPRTRI